MSESEGIVQTASGRLTYAPDGIINNVTRNAQIEEFGHNVKEPVEPSSYSQDDPITATPSSANQTLADSMDHGSSSGNRSSSLAGADMDELKKIATQDRSLHKSDTLALPEGVPALDPTNKQFDLYKWARRFIHEFDQEGLRAVRSGVVFKQLSVSGSGAALQLQQTVFSMLLEPFRNLSFKSRPHKKILSKFDGFLGSGELLIVLGRPGSGCSTFLKTICGELHGLSLDPDSTLHYNGIPQKQMIREFKGEVVYNQEVDKHFPHLTVGQTLEFAASARTPSIRIKNMSRNEHAKHVAQVIMAVFGLSHTYNTKVGNDYVRGVSGGERKRVSIAEMAVTASPLAAWDNSTRGLDSATALKFVQSLRLLANLAGSSHAVAIYQASQAIYDIFDKTILLYEGRQIYYGPASKAKKFFEDQGWYCPPRQTTGDFLTSITNASERKPRDGMENKVPRSVEEFETYWRKSPEYKALLDSIETHERKFPSGGDAAHSMQEHKHLVQAGYTRQKSPYLISIPMQIKLNTKRAYQRIWMDKSSTLTTIFAQIVMALIVGSLFYGSLPATQYIQSLGGALFFAVLLNALIAISEINALYSQRPIVEKQASYAFYHPATEAIAGVISDIPIKFTIAVAFNIILYFMVGLQRTAGQFFLYFLIVFITMFVMSAVFRTMGAVTKTVSQAMTLAGVVVLALVIYTGYVLPVPNMHPWFAWIRWINPIYYAFEILLANQYHGQELICSARIPDYSPSQGDSWICSATGAVAGRITVNGDSYLSTAYGYSFSHVWRNFGILMGCLFGFMAIYFFATEINSSTASTAEVLVFRRGHVPAHLIESHGDDDHEQTKMQVSSQDDEGSDHVDAIPPQQDIFTWQNVVYDIEIKSEQRRLLNHVSGWVKPGTLTALMGVSGAGKTTLLDVLAQRTTMGVITGDMFVNGKPFDASFQRKTGYVQQQDLHLDTATVRESLRFSALLRQPKSVPIKEKYAFVEEVIKMLNMEDFAEAVVGVPGQGLNVEQRKLLTIGVELAAKPKLLLFLDEPTSGLDSQSSWAICAFLRKLADAGQAVLCTIHQPSAILFQEFDRLLFLARGGKTVYFGPIGENSRTLLDYFESNGARKCDDEENPAEYMLEVVNASSSGEGPDWHEVWLSSDNSQQVKKELEKIHADKQNEPADGDDEPESHQEFAMPFVTQVSAVTRRAFQQYWRMPAYIWAKWLLGIMSGLFIGFSFWNSNTSLQGLQNVIFSVFMVSTIFSTLVQQVMPLFVTQRALYEVRERPSKAYSWKAFIIANIVVEIPYQIILGILVFGSYYYAVNGIQSSIRQGLVLLYMIQFFVYASTFGQMCIAALPDAETAASIVTLLFSLSLSFNGVFQAPAALPGFWIFMYRVSPFTYWVSGIAATQLHGQQVTCSARETSIFDPPSGQTCGEYLADYLATSGAQLGNPQATTGCEVCSLTTSDQFLASVGILWADRWRNYGIMWAYIAFNIAAAVFLYYIFRVADLKKLSFKKKSVNKVAEKAKSAGNTAPNSAGSTEREKTEELPNPRPY
ncbi:hypothetical protein AAFC00_003937 [Neodothiora populina]|uniref:ABC transporter domain-containing protein n=1 Tax=Neodothiora populina TaxID=2781224 RepID=A0ABR3PJ32_9PEZI